MAMVQKLEPLFSASISTSSVSAAPMGHDE
ncbi:hypothetical protein JOC77_003691 [Peribacillus deserti]|uniref:Uncharacterized protein n=1 Tax=Peribacillus deserti TaxID=673318 RepID=A0ABS2QM47_9BACI|nr:hypothetical protein [Peribacillus deserti]